MAGGMSSARCRSKACVQRQGLAALGHVKKDPESIWAGSNSELTVSEFSGAASFFRRAGPPLERLGPEPVFQAGWWGTRQLELCLAQDRQALAEHLTRPWLLAVGRRRQVRCCLGGWILAEMPSAAPGSPCQIPPV